VCLQSLPELVQQHDEKPVVIHLQDVRITSRRFKTLQDFMKKVLPDYTVYAELKKCKNARRYQMGVLSFLRNDAAHSAVQVPLEDFVDSDEADPAQQQALLAHCAGRVLVLKTEPPGAPGPVWHLNLYQHTANAMAAARKAVWDVCSTVVNNARDQGAALILGGDLNATTASGQRQGVLGMRAADRVCQQWIKDNKGAAAPNDAAGKMRGLRSWSDPRGRHDADLDHIIAFPSSIPMSHRRLLRPLEVGLDHLPVSVAFHIETLGEHIIMRPDAGFHKPRLKTVDAIEQEPALQHALTSWWERESPQATSALTDDAMLHAYLRDATKVYGSISGWTEKPGEQRKRVLKGHRQLLRELDALYILRREVQRAFDQCGSVGLAALQEHRFTMWQKASIRHQVMRHTLPPEGQARDAGFWGATLDSVRDAVKTRQTQVKREQEADQKLQLQRALGRIRGDFQGSTPPQPPLHPLVGRDLQPP
jgi:hypothetical protein